MKFVLILIFCRQTCVRQHCVVVPLQLQRPGAQVPVCVCSLAYMPVGCNMVSCDGWSVFPLNAQCSLDSLWIHCKLD